MTTPLETLMLDPHIVSITPPTYISTPEVDYTLFNQSQRTKMENGVNAIVGYFSRPIIIDNFTNHTDRNTWLQQLPTPVIEYVQQNKFRNNSLNPLNYVGLLNMFYVGSQKEEIATLTQQIEQQVQETAKDYSQINDKVTQIKELEKLLYSFLELIAVK